MLGSAGLLRCNRSGLVSLVAYVGAYGSSDLWRIPDLVEERKNRACAER